MNQSVLPGFEFLLMVTKEIMQEYSRITMIHMNRSMVIK